MELECSFYRTEVRVATNRSNRHEKHKTLEILLRADFLHIFKILHFSRFSKIINSTCNVEIILFFAEHGRRTRQNGINPVFDDRYFMTAAHFRFQCETLKINFTYVFKMIL